MKISEIRRVIESCNWARNDLSGATTDEFRKMKVPMMLLGHIADVAALVIPARFVRDIADQQHAIEAAERMIARWEEKQ
jgi:hypothetical protein